MYMYITYIYIYLSIYLSHVYLYQIVPSSRRSKNFENIENKRWF